MRKTQILPEYHNMHEPNKKGVGESRDSLDGTHGTRPPHSDSLERFVEPV